MMTPRLSRVRDALNQVARGPAAATATASLKLKSPLNGAGLATSRGARMADNARRKRERGVGALLAERLNVSTGVRHVPRAHRVAVLLTRVSPKVFDDDNLAAAFKSVRDGMAAWWGIDDGGDAVTWLYDDEKGPAHTHEVRASLWVLSPAAVTPFNALVEQLGENEPGVVAVPVNRMKADAARRAVVHGGLIQRREVRVTPNVIRRRGGL